MSDPSTPAAIPQRPQKPVRLELTEEKKSTKSPTKQGSDNSWIWNKRGITEGYGPECDKKIKLI